MSDTDKKLIKWFLMGALGGTGAGIQIAVGYILFIGPPINILGLIANILVFVTVIWFLKSLKKTNQ
ncbi:MAG: hypothetical protein AAGE61_00795 [Pseudomonadota bacterium]